MDYLRVTKHVKNSYPIKWDIDKKWTYKVHSTKTKRIALRNDTEAVMPVTRNKVRTNEDNAIHRET